jgi:transcription elongation factor Elf1
MIRRARQRKNALSGPFACPVCALKTLVAKEKVIQQPRYVTTYRGRRKHMRLIRYKESIVKFFCTNEECKYVTAVQISGKQEIVDAYCDVCDQDRSPELEEMLRSLVGVNRDIKKIVISDQKVKL